MPDKPTPASQPVAKSETSAPAPTESATTNATPVEGEVPEVRQSPMNEGTDYSYLGQREDDQLFHTSTSSPLNAREGMPGYGTNDPTVDTSATPPSEPPAETPAG